MKNFVSGAMALMLLLCLGCGSKKRIFGGNKIASFNKIERTGPSDNSANRFEFKIDSVNGTIKADIDDKTDYYVIKNIGKDSTKLTTKSSVKSLEPGALQPHLGTFFFPAEGMKATSLRYGDGAFGLQALTVPLKFRQKIGDGSLYPANVETGTNLGFAGLYKLNYNIFNPGTKFLGKSLRTLSLSGGLFTSLGAEQLKAATNAPGLKPDRQLAMYSGGAVLLLGFNNINFGYAIGRDHALGQGGKYWIYQGKTWQGVIVSLDVLKF